MDTSPRDNGSNSNAPGQGGANDDGFPKPNPSGGRPLGMPAIIMLALAALALVTIVIREQAGSVTPVSWDEFVREVKAGNVAEVRISGNSLEGQFKAPAAETGTGEVGGGAPRTFQIEISPYLGEGLSEMLLEHEVKTTVRQPADGTGLLLGIYMLVPLLLMAGFWMTLRRARDPLGGSGFLGGFSKSPAKRYGSSDRQVTFSDVAGLEQVKEDLKEIVDFLKDPRRFQRLGGRVPKGVLLMGPPGTGKTLLARAVAGEAGVPFFSISGSEFIQMFVGVGASRVRDLFDQAKRNSPCIVFIDEIDAVGRQRGAGLGGSHDEREQTLNQILVEMDGFETGTNVIIVAATNRPDVLDPALLRPGRFDRQVILDRPDLKGRLAILKVHVKGKPLDKSVNLEEIARRSPGFSGADLANLMNEAAILAARRSKRTIGMDEFAEALDRVMAGPQRKSRLITDAEKQIIAYHEGGHAVVGRILEKCDPVSKVTVISRGMALGYTMNLPTEDRYLQSKSEFEDKIAAMLGGNVAEQLVFGDTTTGASNDIEKATDLARKMVTRFGMSEKLGTVTLGRQDEMIFLGREMSEQKNYSEAVAKQIDEEVRAIIDRGAVRAREVLTKHRDRLDALAAKLIAEETVEGEAFETLFADLPAKPAAYAGLLDRLRAAGVSIPVAKVEPKSEPVVKPGPGGAAAGQPA